MSDEQTKVKQENKIPTDNETALLQSMNSNTDSRSDGQNISNNANIENNKSSSTTTTAAAAAAVTTAKPTIAGQSDSNDSTQLDTENKDPSKEAPPPPPTNTTTAKAGSGNSKAEKPKAFTIKYKRPRGSRACTVCRSRKVRCDAEIHIPCTNCITFGCDCVLPEVKKRGNQSGESKAKKQKLAAAAAASATAETEATSTTPASATSTDETKAKVKAKIRTSKEGNANRKINGVEDTTTKSTFQQSPISSTTPAFATNNSLELTKTNKELFTATPEKQLLPEPPTQPRTQAANHNHYNHHNHHNHQHHTHHNQNSHKLPIHSEPILNISQVSIPPSLTSTYKNRPSMHKKELMSSKSKPSMTFLGSSSVGVIPQNAGENHVQLTEDIFDVSDTGLDSVELEILKLRGAFLLPSKDLAMDLINAYFQHVHPLMPVINRSLFMKKFNDPNDNPSLMVLHAVLLCGSRVSKNPLLLDSNGSTNLASLTFFRRAKALYEMNYESDPVSIIQTVILIGSYWDGPEDVTKNSFYWTRVAVGLAQGFGFQRDVTESKNLTISEKRLWRKIWWCLFEKDRNVAIAFGRPVVIDLSDCDVPMLSLEDFDETDPELGITEPYPVNETHALYFIHLIKLAEITGIIIKHQYSVKLEMTKRRNAFSIIEHCDMLMGIWFTNLPPQLSFSLADSSSQNFYACLLNAQYYNRLFLIHRSNLIRMAKSSSTNPNNYKYPSWGISFQSARMISIISKILLDRDLLKYVPTMYVYIAFSALIMLIYHVDSNNAVIASTASDSLFVSRSVLKKLSLYWPIAGVLIKLFDKYANDKMKRASVIENGSRMADYQEKVANEKQGMGQTGLYDNMDTRGYSLALQPQPLLPNHQQNQQSPQQQNTQQNTQQNLQHRSFVQQQQQQHISQIQQRHSPVNTKYSPGSTTSGISPGGNSYNDYQNPQPLPVPPVAAPIPSSASAMSSSGIAAAGPSLSPNTVPQLHSRAPIPPHTYSNVPSVSPRISNSRTPQIEQLIQQYKVPMKKAKDEERNGGSGGISDGNGKGEVGKRENENKTNDTSPSSSSMKSFPDISLVTENIPNKQTFFENFEPTQLFPTFSIPPTRAQSPSAEGASGLQNAASAVTSQVKDPHGASIPPNEQASQSNQFNQPAQEDGLLNSGTSGLQTNFVDSSYINMNLQSGIDMNDDFSSFFNFIN